jgi:protein SCO1/2
MRKMTRIFALFAAAAVVVGLGIGGFVALRDGGADPFADCRGGTVAAGGSAAIGGPFSLTDGTGARVTDVQAITKPTLVYFGYTFCPDFCPTDLSRNALAAESLEKRGIDVGQIFISIDPARDTPAVVRDFTGAIDPKIVGLTGTPEEVDAAAKAYRVFYRKAGDDPEYYLMEHTTFTYLMAPGVGFLEFYPSDATPDALANSVACFTARL